MSPSLVGGPRHISARAPFAPLLEGGPRFGGRSPDVFRRVPSPLPDAGRPWTAPASPARAAGERRVSGALMVRMGHDSIRPNLIYQDGTSEASQAIAAGLDAQVKASREDVDDGSEGSGQRPEGENDGPGVRPWGPLPLAANGPLMAHGPSMCDVCRLASRVRPASGARRSTTRCRRP